VLVCCVPLKGKIIFKKDANKSNRYNDTCG
jgi:hypothetical protein